ncbi:RPL15 [Symbiodinium sp. CCMP2592]|nr:RPL15 [Symbiodinium sp. CCMP2592]
MKDSELFVEDAIGDWACKHTVLDRMEFKYVILRPEMVLMWRDERARQRQASILKEGHGEKFMQELIHAEHVQLTMKDFHVKFRLYDRTIQGNLPRDFNAPDKVKTNLAGLLTTMPSGGPWPFSVRMCLAIFDVILPDIRLAVMVSYQSNSLVQRLSSVSRAKRRQLYREASSPGMAPLHSGVRQEGNNDKFLDTCLIDSLRGLGYKIPYSRDGPFWAKADGDRFLAPYGPLSCIRIVDYNRSHRDALKRCVVAVPIHALNSHGSFVVCFREHFVAVRRNEEGLWVNQTHRTHECKPLSLRTRRGTALAWSQEQNHLTFWKWTASSGLKQKALDESANVYTHDVKASDKPLNAAGDELQHGSVSLDADQAGFSVSEGVDSELVPLEDDCTKDVTGGATFLQTCWATCHGFIVQEDGERRQSASR